MGASRHRPLCTSLKLHHPRLRRSGRRHSFGAKAVLIRGPVGRRQVAAGAGGAAGGRARRLPFARLVADDRAHIEARARAAAGAPGRAAGQGWSRSAISASGGWPTKPVAVVWAGGRPGRRRRAAAVGGRRKIMLDGIPGGSRRHPGRPDPLPVLLAYLHARRHLTALRACGTPAPAFGWKKVTIMGLGLAASATSQARDFPPFSQCSIDPI